MSSARLKELKMRAVCWGGAHARLTLEVNGKRYQIKHCTNLVRAKLSLGHNEQHAEVLRRLGECHSGGKVALLFALGAFPGERERETRKKDRVSCTPGLSKHNMARCMRVCVRVCVCACVGFRQDISVLTSLACLETS